MEGKQKEKLGGQMAAMVDGVVDDPHRIRNIADRRRADVLRTILETDRVRGYGPRVAIVGYSDSADCLACLVDFALHRNECERLIGALIGPSEDEEDPVGYVAGGDDFSPMDDDVASESVVRLLARASPQSVLRWVREVIEGDVNHWLWDLAFPLDQHWKARVEHFITNRDLARAYETLVKASRYLDDWPNAGVTTPTLSVLVEQVWQAHVAAEVFDRSLEIPTMTRQGRILVTTKRVEGRSVAVKDISVWANIAHADAISRLRAGDELTDAGMKLRKLAVHYQLQQIARRAVRRAAMVTAPV